MPPLSRNASIHEEDKETMAAQILQRAHTETGTFQGERDQTIRLYELEGSQSLCGVCHRQDPYSAKEVLLYAPMAGPVSQSDLFETACGRHGSPPSDLGCCLSARIGSLADGSSSWTNDTVLVLSACQFFFAVWEDALYRGQRSGSSGPSDGEGAEVVSEVSYGGA